jgi:hypothetical protein
VAGNCISECGPSDVRQLRARPQCGLAPLGFSSKNNPKKRPKFVGGFDMTSISPSNDQGVIAANGKDVILAAA